MARKRNSRRLSRNLGRNNPFERRIASELGKGSESMVHIYGDNFVCDTEARGHKTRGGRPATEIVVDASDGFIPLWAKGTILRWRFRESSFHSLVNPTAAKTAITNLFGKVVLAWGDAAPIQFTHDDDTWDFEFVIKHADSCDINGCVLASAFFPDAGRHSLYLYPMMFTQSDEQQLRTLEHEIGHVFGLRHFFAQIRETDAPSELFGEQNPFTIMNYGSKSVLTDADRADLKKLYQLAWSGKITSINGTPIRFVKPYHTIGE